MSSNHAYNTFYENIIYCSIATKITLPTWICDTASTLIDNVYTNVLDKSHTSGILIRPISDHQMYFCIMNENFGKSATHKNRLKLKLSTVSLLKLFKMKLLTCKCTINWTQTSMEILITIMKLLRLYCKMQKNRHIPKHVTKFNKRRHKKQKWMTDELLENIVIKTTKKLNVCCMGNYSSYRCKL